MVNTSLRTIASLLIFYASMISGSPADIVSQYETAQNLPSSFASKDDLEKSIRVDEWLECKAGFARFFVCRTRFPSSAMPNDLISCWRTDLDTGRLWRVWEVHLANAGPVKIIYDEKTTCLSLIETGNTEFKNRAVVSVFLSIL
jgi:hypothetical protein